jgi:hypothetical protein
MNLMRRLDVMSVFREDISFLKEENEDFRSFKRREWEFTLERMSE